MPDITDKQWDAFLAFVKENVLPIVLIVVVALIAMRLANMFVHGIVKALLDREAFEGTAQELSAVELKKRMDTLESLLGNALRFFIVVIAGLMVMGRLGLDIGPAVAGLGVVGIAVGFGAQNMVRDYLNGAYILVENQFAKGDVVRIAGVAGSVEDFTLRRTTLRDLDGVVHTVPNGEIKVASNLTRVWSRINQDVTVAYGTDVDKAMAVVEEVGRQMAGEPAWKRRILEAPRVERVAGAGRVRDHPQDPRHGPGAGPVGRGRRAAQAPARRVRGERHRDPAAAAGRHLAAAGRTRRARPARRRSHRRGARPRGVTAGSSRRAAPTAG